MKCADAIEKVLFTKVETAVGPYKATKPQPENEQV